jgi:hypothetical protein
MFPEVIDMTEYPIEEPEQETIPPYAIQYADIGDVLQQGVDQPIPEGWHECDGSLLRSLEWRDFAKAMRITTPTFVLPKPERTLPGQIWIIKLGPKRSFLEEI